MRWAPLAVGLVFLVSSMVWLANDALLPRYGYGAGSSLSTAPEGLSLARAYLAGQGTEVGTMARTISLQEPAPDAVVFRVAPWTIPPRPDVHSDGGADNIVYRTPGADGGALDEDDEDEDEDEGDASSHASDAGTQLAAGDAGTTLAQSVFETAVPNGLLGMDEARFVAAGGRLVLAINRRYGPLRVEPADGSLEKVFPALPGVRELDVQSTLGLAGPGLVDSVAVFERGSAPVVARRMLGKGDVWLLSAPELFFNARLARGDNLALLAELAGRGRPVLFDESAHFVSDNPGALDLLRRWGFGPALLLLALAAGVWFWRRAVTLGAPAVWRDLRTESVDLVEALSQLYQRALRPADALALHHARLVHDIQLRLGLGPQAAAEKARELTGGWEPSGPGHHGSADFQRHLDVLNKAFRRLRDDSVHRA